MKEFVFSAKKTKDAFLGASSCDFIAPLVIRFASDFRDCEGVRQ